MSTPVRPMPGVEKPSGRGGAMLEEPRFGRAQGLVTHLWRRFVCVGDERNWRIVATTLFRQTWWVSVAVVLALLQIVFAVGIALDSEATTTDRLVIGLVWGASAGIALTGAARRPHSRRMGDALIGLGVLPTAMGGVISSGSRPCG
jgi:hypothetical protein